MEENLKIWNDAKRIVVKVGSSLVTNEGHGVDTEAVSYTHLTLPTKA